MKKLIYKKRILISFFVAISIIVFVFNISEVKADSSSSSSSDYSSSYSSSSTSSSSYSYSVENVSVSEKVYVCIDCVNPKPTCSVSLSPTSITGGGSSVLSWVSTNATAVFFDNGIGSALVNGFRTVSPFSSITYTGTFTGPGGTTTCSATLSVNNPPVTPTCSVSLNKTSIASGEKSVLSWSSSNVTSAVFNQGLGNVSVTGSSDVFPTSNTTYTGTFTGPGGTTTCSATLSVNNPPVTPTCSVSLNKTSIASGEKSVLSWSSSNVTSAVFNQGLGNVSVTGSSDVFPTSNTTYTGTFTGPDGTVTCNASLEILTDPNKPSCSIGVGSSKLSSGQSTILYWSSRNISTTTINQNIGRVNNSGSIVIKPKSSTTYRGTFEGEDGVVICTAKVSIGGGGGENPPNVSLSSNTFGTEPSFIYLSQIPYTGIPEFIIYLFRVIFFGGLLYLYYRISGRNWKVKTK